MSLNLMNPPRRREMRLSLPSLLSLMSLPNLPPLCKHGVGAPRIHLRTGSEVAELLARARAESEEGCGGGDGG